MSTRHGILRAVSETTQLETPGAMSDLLHLAAEAEEAGDLEERDACLRDAMAVARLDRLAIDLSHEGRRPALPAPARKPRKGGSAARN